MKKVLALILAFVMVLGLAACGGKASEPSQPESNNTQPPDSNPPVDNPPDDNPPDDPGTSSPNQLPSGMPSFFQLSICEEDGSYKSLTAYPDGTGTITLEYQGQIRKMASMDASVMTLIMAQFGATGLMELNGENIFEDGIISGSMYISYDSGEYFAAGYSGTIPQTFLTGYQVMDIFFQSLLADVPEYVARPVIMGEVNAEALAELETILENSGMEPLDMFSISDVAKDEYFAMTMGLSSDAGILVGTSLAPMMSPSAFSCVIATLENQNNIASVQKDFAENIDWNKWVCVSADYAMIAKKGNMVLCLVSAAQMYEATADAIEANGWTVLEELSR